MKKCFPSQCIVTEWFSNFNNQKINLKNLVTSKIIAEDSNKTIISNLFIHSIHSYNISRYGHFITKNKLFFLLIFQSIAQVTSEKPYFFRLPINLVIRQTNSQPIVKMTAKEFMFGYESPLTTLGNKFMPDWIYFEKVGLIDRVSSDFFFFIYFILI